MPKESSLIVPDEIIMNRIYYTRGQKVMIDTDLSKLYEVENKRLNEQVKRNIQRFPKDFMFRLTQSEFENWKSQMATSSWGGTRKLPNVFTEQGVAMLSSVLNSEKAIKVNIHIIRIFTRIRQVLNDNTGLRLEIEQIKTKLNKHDKNIDLVFRYLDELVERKEVVERKKIGYKIKN
jgi:hypothetical protein